MNKLFFLKKFIKHLSVGLSVLVLLAVLSQTTFSDIFNRGPKVASASSCDWYEADYDNGFPAGYYTLIGSDASDPAAWSACDPNNYSYNPSSNYPTDNYSNYTQPAVDNWTQLNNECDWNSGQAYTVWFNSATGEYWRGIDNGEAWNDPSCGYDDNSYGGNSGYGEDSWTQLNNECDWNSGQAYTVWFNSATGEYWRGIDYNEAWLDSACGYEDPTQYGTYSVRFVCYGQHSECGGNGPSPISEEWGTYMSASDPFPGCDKTVQVDVFRKYCRDASGLWICGMEDLMSFNVWYSGSCPVEQPLPPYEPVQPIYPNNPHYPVVPVRPQYPVNPVYPVQPVQPIQPIYPVHPVQPVQPIQPVYPVQPIQPIYPVQPQQPVYPVQPVQPVQQTQHQEQYVTVPQPQVVTAPAPIIQQPPVVQTPPQVIQQPQPQVVTTQPQVVTAGVSYVKELPNTGLPLAVLGAFGLAPAGLALRRFAKKSIALSANYLWEDRQFKASN